MTQTPRQRGAKRSLVSYIPVVNLVAKEWRLWRDERSKPRFGLEPVTLGSPDLPAYPIAMAPLLALPFGHLDADGVPYNVKNGAYGGAYQPTSIAQYALAQWNAYLRDHDERRLQAFLAQARWLAAHETRLVNGAGVWPIPFPAPAYGAPGPWLSALTQGNVASVMTRAYRVTGDAAWLAIARRAVHAFTVDILDGGVQAPVGGDGVFFEEAATYPAARILNGYILALFGLYDYIELTGDAAIKRLAEQSVETLHSIISGYDMGFWSRYDLLHQQPANRFYHTLHIHLLRALARYTGCQHCLALADRWARYDRSLRCRAHYYWTSRTLRYRTGLARLARRRSLARAQRVDGRLQVCAPITAFPVAGGMRGVLFGVEQAMADEWRMEYLTRTIGPDPQDHTIHRFEWRFHPFGPETTSFALFPNVWFYMSAGRRKLARLVRQRRYDVLAPQDGVFTAAFTTRVARRMGIPVVTMDHGNVTLPFDDRYRQQRLQDFRRQPFPKRTLSRMRFAIYLRVLRRLLRRATPQTDRFLIAGDEVEDAYRKRLHVLPDRIIRYPYRVDVNRFALASADERAQVREALGLATDALVVTLINRLAPEKGLEFAIAGLAQAYHALPAGERSRLRVVIAGSGPLRAELERWIAAAELEAVCALAGEATPDDVTRLLKASDIFLYTGTRGTNYSMAVLEAMAAGCAVIATTEPRSNARLLADGRGIALAPGDADAVGVALTHMLTQHAERERMGQAAREYTATYHSDEALRRSLRRALPWAPEIAAYTADALTADALAPNPESAPGDMLAGGQSEARQVVH
ncbi:MAG: D-glucuronyl C5-epimerase family protein [Ktedonobacterales bacterium]